MANSHKATWNKRDWREVGTPHKSKNASKVLQLMDKDFSYADAVKRIMNEARISKVKLERELDPFI